MPFRVELKTFEIGVGRWEARLLSRGQKRKVEEQGAGALPESCFSVTAFLVVLERRITDDVCERKGPCGRERCQFG